MNKKGILILAISAVVVIAGAISATVLLRNNLPEKNDVVYSTTAPQQSEYDFGSDYQNVYEPVTIDPAQEETTLAGEVLETLNQITQATKKPAKKPNKTTTTKKATADKPEKTPSGSVSYPGDDKLVDKVIGPNGEQFLGYRYDADGDFYYTDDKDCWQSNAGYNEVYDNMAPAAAMQIDQVRIRFTYEKKDWMIQLWKGQYGFLLIGAEIGVYTAPEGSHTGEVGSVNHYDCAGKEDWLKMEMTCYWKENNQGSYKKAFEREYGYYWWATGFVKGQLTKYTTPRTELKLKARITFKTEEMANLFVMGMRESGFARALGSNQLVDDSFYQKGADVWFLWTTKYHDCFVGYEG